MKYTSSEASKLLRTINEELLSLKSMESKTCTFVCSSSESIESVRPNYLYGETQIKIKELEKKVRKIKHAINVFNTTTEVNGFDGMTIDQMLIYLPQLNATKEKLSRMVARLPKERCSSYGNQSTNIDYTYANYDIARAEADLKEITDEIVKAQTALDVVNTTVTMEISL